MHPRQNSCEPVIDIHTYKIVEPMLDKTLPDWEIMHRRTSIKLNYFADCYSTNNITARSEDTFCLLSRQYGNVIVEIMEATAMLRSNSGSRACFSGAVVKLRFPDEFNGMFQIRDSNTSQSSRSYFA